MRDPDQVTNCLMILKERGIDLVRIRVLVPPIIASYWDNELAGNSTIDEVIPVAVKAKALGLRILISLDYSWTLADPANQRIPVNWVNNIANRPTENPINLLAAEVSANTTEVLSRLKAAGVTPEFVALGNEITNGMLLHVENKGSTPIARTSPNYGSRGNNLAKFVNAGYYAAKAIDPNIKVVIHIDRAHNDGLDVGFFNTLKQCNGHWDVSATDTSADLVSDISQTVDDLATKFSTPGFGGEGVLMMEMEPPTVYPNNTYNPYIDVSSGTTRDFNFVTDILKLMRAVPGGKGVGALYWEGEADPDWRGYLQATWANEEPTPVLNAFLPTGFVPPPSLTSLPQATAKSGVAFSYQIKAANSPSTFSAIGLPPGLTLNPSTGFISGTPGNVSSPRGYVVYNVALSVVTSQGAVSGNLRLKVNGAVSGALPPAFFSSPSAITNVGDLFWYTIQASNVDPSTIKIISPLPPGLKAVSSSAIQGTPTTPGLYSIGFTVANSAGVAHGSLILTVKPAPQKTVFTSSLNMAASLASPFEYAITTADSTSILGATGLPPGLTISFDGVITGTPTKTGTFPVTISATNIAGTATATLNITVASTGVTLPAPVISSSGSATATVLQPFSFAVTASNTPTSFTATGLPSGLSINPTTGVISGTPTRAGSSVIHLSATNSGGTGIGTVSLTVNPPPVVTPPSPVISSAATASATVGTFFTYKIAASNAPASFNATGLSAGLTVNTTTGVISGTPTGTGSAVIHLSATNTGGTGSKILTLTINPAAPVISSADTANGTVGTAFTYAIAASNSPTGFGATGLPAGLALSANGVIGGTPTTAGSFTVALSASNSGGTGSSMLIISIQQAVSQMPPTAPTKLTAVALSPNEIKLSWQDSSTGIGGYTVQRAINPAGPFTTVTVTGGSTTTTFDSGLRPQVTYYYQVLAENKEGNSKSSNIAAATTLADISQNGLVAYWSFDEGAGTSSADLSGNGHTATLAGAAWTIGEIGAAAVSFPGSSVSVSVPNNGALQFNDQQSFTLSAWVAPGALASQDEAVVAKSADQGNTYGIAIDASHHWVFRGPDSNVQGPLAVSGTWQQVTAVQDASLGKRYLYINGVLVASGKAQNANGAGDLWIGAAKSLNQPFSGSVDEVRLYSRAIPPSLITTLMSAPIIQATSVQNQGTAGPIGFDIPTDGSAAVEARAGAVAGRYVLVLNFNSPVSGLTDSLGLQGGSTGAEGTVTSLSYDSTHTVVTVQLDSVGNAQRLNLHLAGILPGNGTADVPFNLLVGDANGDGIVNQEDLSLVQAYVSSRVTPDNIALDVNSNGVIDAADVALVSAHLGTQLGTLPVGWSDRDIGLVGLTGSAAYNNGVFTLLGSGADIWNTTDGFHYAYQNLTGDGTIIAYVVSQVSGQDKAGVMIRQDLTPDSPYVQIAIHQRAGIKLEYRTTAGAQAQITGWDTAVKAAPYWLKLSRSGNTFTAFVSADGINWVEQSAALVVPMATSAYIGLSESSHNNSAANTSTFRNVNIVPGTVWSSQDIGAPALAGLVGYNNGVFSVTAGGTDIWNFEDQFHFVYKSLTGDGTLTAKVNSMSGSEVASVWSKSGLMMRTSLDASSANVLVAATSGRGITFQWRPAASERSQYVDVNSIKTPYWIRLNRSGNLFTASASPDGVIWTPLGSETLSLPSTLYVGLALTSHNGGKLAQTAITNFTLH